MLAEVYLCKGYAAFGWHSLPGMPMLNFEKYWRCRRFSYDSKTKINNSTKRWTTFQASTEFTRIFKENNGIAPENFTWPHVPESRSFCFGYDVTQYDLTGCIIVVSSSLNAFSLNCTEINVTERHVALKAERRSLFMIDTPDRKCAFRNFVPIFMFNNSHAPKKAPLKNRLLFDDSE